MEYSWVSVTWFWYCTLYHTTALRVSAVTQQLAKETSMFSFGTIFTVSLIFFASPFFRKCHSSRNSIGIDSSRCDVRPVNSGGHQVGIHSVQVSLRSHASQAPVRLHRLSPLIIVCWSVSPVHSEISHVVELFLESHLPFAGKNLVSYTINVHLYFSFGRAPPFSGNFFIK